MKKYFTIEWDENEVVPGPESKMFMNGDCIETFLNYHFSGRPYKVTEIQLHCGHSIDAIVTAHDEMGDCSNSCRMCEEEERRG